MNKYHLEKAIIFVCLMLFAAAGLSAMGKTDETEPETVRGLENWDHSIDVTDLEPGEYNIVVRAEDSAGNIGIGGPYNVFIDPSIQIPQVSISTPVSGGLVGRRLHALGTASDDKAVVRVEIAVDEGNFRAADGTDFWSFSEDCSSWDDGVHILKARSVDAEGRESPVAEVSFYKDSGKPVVELISHSSGSYISGRTVLEGIVTDLNGVSELLVSDGISDSLKRVKLSGGKTAGQWQFKYTVDTKQYSDGINVFHFEASDSLGVKAGQSFLFYIDNKPPELSLGSPVEGDSVNGRFVMTGKAFDAVGISSLVYNADNGSEGEIEFKPGNPVWVLPLDYSGFKGKQAKVSMALTDIVGNTVEQVFKIPLDAEADLPKPGMSEASSGIFIDVPVIRGLLADDDGTEGQIEYSLNGVPPQRIDVSGPWSLEFPEAVPGVNRLELRAYDKFGTAGRTVKAEFSRAYSEPVLVFDSFLSGEEEDRWFPGMVIDSKTTGSIEGRIINPEGVGSLSWMINGEEAGSRSIKPAAGASEIPFSIKLPKNLPSGRMELTAITGLPDAAPVSAGTVYYNYQKPEPAEDGTVASFEYPDSRGLYLEYPYYYDGKGSLLLKAGYDISGWTAGAGIRSVKISGNSGFLSVETGNDAFRITAGRDGIAENAVITVELDNGDKLSSDPVSLIADESAPEINLNSPSAGQVTGDRTAVSFSSEADGVPEFSVDGGKSFNRMPDGGIINTGSLPDGLIDFVIKAADDNGNTAEKYLPLLKDTKAPELEFITSEFERGSAQITYTGRVSEQNGLAGITFRFLPGEGAEAAEYPAETDSGFFHLDINLTELGFEPIAVEISAEDSAGNIQIQTLKPDVALAEGKPKVDIQVPAEMGSSETGFNLSGLVFDREGVESVRYSLNNGPFMEAGNSSLFNVPIELDNLNDNLNSVKVKATDLNGLESETEVRNFLISLEDPEVTIDYPSLEETVRGTILLKGRAEDANGIKAVYISHDNGNTFQRTSGREEWTYTFDTQLLNDGVSPLLFRAVDMAGVEAYFTTLINVDNTAPDISLSSPSDGEPVRGMLSVNGMIIENSTLEKAKIIMSPLNVSAEDISYEITAGRNLNESIDLSDIEPGDYSFRIEAADNAENTGSVSRVIHVLPAGLQKPVILAPLPGEILGPGFTIQGWCPESVPRAEIFLNGRIFDTVETDDSGFFRLDISAGDSAKLSGNVSDSIQAVVRIEDGINREESEPVVFEYSARGMWVSIGNVSEYRHVSDRFMIEGNTGFYTDIEDEKELKRLQPKTVEISLDGGRSYEKCRLKKGAWTYTLYSAEVPDGDIDLLVRSSNGQENAYARCRAVMDSKKPDITLLTPGENEHLYGSLMISGEASDENGLTEVSISLREGDKDSYETPSFIQGMYFDASALGATYFTAGLGLTFMDDNVKLQMQYGYAPTTVIDPETNRERNARFGGNVLGAKLLANVAQVPFSWLFGPEWSFMSASAAVGANFSYFSSNTTGGEDNWGVVLAGVVGQLEVPKITFENRRFLKYVSVFWEGQLWLISSDVSPEVILLPSIGARVGLF